MSDHQAQRGDASRAATRSRSRSRSRERDALRSEPPRRQLRSTTRAAAAADASRGDRPDSFSPLHDDELLCVLPFLSLKDVALLMRCSRRFNVVARREPSRGERLSPLVHTVPSLASSPLNYHVRSISLAWHHQSEHVTRTTLHHLRSLPRLTELTLHASSNEAAAALLQGTSSTTAAAMMQAALPTSLRSFSFVNRTILEEPSADFVRLGPAFLAGAATMPQLTELYMCQKAPWDDMPLDALVAAPLLRKLTMSAYRREVPLSRIKALSQLRELILERVDLETSCRCFNLRIRCSWKHSSQMKGSTKHRCVHWAMYRP
jgi:hypothetical protein